MKKVKLKTFPQGVHPYDGKSLSERCAVRVLPLPEDVFISLSQHIGAPSQPIVEVGQTVKRGQLIATANGAVSSNVYASVGGEVVEISPRTTATGSSATHIHIKKTNSDTVLLKPLTEKTPESIRARIAEAGIVGMGGAGFPTAVKLNPVNPVDTMLINGAECEPYLTCDDRLMREKAKEVATGADLLKLACGAKTVVFGVESNKIDAINALIAAGANVCPLKTKYPQGSEKQLIYAALRRKVPVGKLPAEVGVVVQNVATAYATYQAVEENLPLIERVMTVSGGGVKEPANVIAANGTPFSVILQQCGGISEDTVKLLAGGPMMGFSTNDDATTTKGSNGLLALTESEVSLADPSPCINCGRCARACPMRLMPMYIDLYALVGEWNLTVKYGALNCFECGACSYVCPAKRPLVQSIRLAKAKLRERK
jgi:electron transport complex protein RnfC